MKYVHKNQIDFLKNSIKNLALLFDCFALFEATLSNMLCARNYQHDLQNNYPAYTLEQKEFMKACRCF